MSNKPIEASMKPRNFELYFSKILIMQLKHYIKIKLDITTGGKDRSILIPRSQTWNLMLLYCTVSTLNPIAAFPQTKAHLN